MPAFAVTVPPVVISTESVTGTGALTVVKPSCCSCVILIAPLKLRISAVVAAPPFTPDRSTPDPTLNPSEEACRL